MQSGDLFDADALASLPESVPTLPGAAGPAGSEPAPGTSPAQAAPRQASHASPSHASHASQASHDLTSLVIALLKSVLYRDDDAALWEALLNLQARVRDYVAVLALDLVLDEAEGYAFLRARPQSDDDDAPKLPRLVPRRPLSFQLSLLLALLRKKLAEFDASGGDTRLILSREAVAELVRVFMPAGSNESRLMDLVETQLNKIVELGFVRKLKSSGNRAQSPSYEVRRI